MKKDDNKRIGLALGGGGARGWAHIGVIKALQDAEIPIDFIAGTSIGALVGGVYASGNLKKFESFAKTINIKKTLQHLDVKLSNKGFLNGEKIKSLLSEKFTKKTIQSTNVPFTAVAVDIMNGKEVHFRSGNLVDAIRASISIPGIFVPAQIKGRHYVDGGVTNPLPIDVVRSMGADLVIAVDLNNEVTARRKKDKSKNKINKWMLDKMRPNLIDFLGNTINLMQKKITQENLKNHPADFLIQPKLGHVMLFDFHLAESMIKEAYKMTQKIIPAIRKSYDQ